MFGKDFVSTHVNNDFNDDEMNLYRGESPNSFSSSFDEDDEVNNFLGNEESQYQKTKKNSPKKSVKNDLNLVEMGKCIYPNYLSNGLMYDLVNGKAIESDERHFIMGIYLRDDCYDVIFFNKIEDLEDIGYCILYVVRVRHQDYDNIKNWLEWNLVESKHIKLSNFVCNLETRIACDSNPNLNFLTIENFPKLLLDDLPMKISKSEMSDTMEKKSEFNYSRLKRHIYKCITSRDSYQFDMYDMDDEADETLHVYVRIIRYKDMNGNYQFTTSHNNDETNYPYDDYDIWCFMIPPSHIPINVSINLLLENFKSLYIM